MSEGSKLQRISRNWVKSRFSISSTNSGWSKFPITTLSQQIREFFTRRWIYGRQERGTRASIGDKFRRASAQSMTPGKCQEAPNSGSGKIVKRYFKGAVKEATSASRYIASDFSGRQNQPT